MSIKIINNIKMLYYDRIDVFEGIGISKIRVLTFKQMSVVDVIDQ